MLVVRASKEIFAIHGERRDGVWLMKWCISRMTYSSQMLSVKCMSRSRTNRPSAISSKSHRERHHRVKVFSDVLNALDAWVDKQSGTHRRKITRSEKVTITLPKKYTLGYHDRHHASTRHTQVV